MFYEINFSEYKKARIWIDELPAVEYKADNFISPEPLAGNETLKVAAKSVCVELYVSHGPRMLYAVLGAEFKENTSGATEIYVGSSAAPTRTFENPVAKVLTKIDKLFVGLPENYAKAVCRGASEAIKNIGNFPSVNLVINYAAYAEISSSEAFFYKVSKLLPLFALLKDKEASTETIERLLQEI